MESESVIQRICFRNSCGLFLRDLWTINFERYCLLISSVLHIVLFFLSINIVNNFKACCWFHFHPFVVTPGS